MEITLVDSTLTYVVDQLSMEARIGLCAITCTQWLSLLCTKDPTPDMDKTIYAACTLCSSVCVLAENQVIACQLLGTALTARAD